MLGDDAGALVEVAARGLLERGRRREVKPLALGTQLRLQRHLTGERMDEREPAPGMSGGLLDELGGDQIR